jgi:hypothetical protein
MGKVRVNTNPGASAYAGANERIIEFSAGTNGAGGLISLTEADDGTIRVHVYRHEQTAVTVGKGDDARPAVKFFYEHGPSSHNPETQTADEGRWESARAYARAEQAGRDAAHSYEWEIDPDIDSSEFSDERPSWALWECIVYNADREPIGSLSGIDFGRDGMPSDNPYRRVVEAQLSMEALASMPVTS